MEALNAAGLTPISVLCEKRNEPRKIWCPPTSPLKFSGSAPLSTTSLSLQDCLSRSYSGSLVVLSSVLSTGLAKALTYEEALQQSAGTAASESDASGVLDNVISFATENPVVIAGGAVVLAVPLILSQILKKPKSWGVESAKKAYALLGDDANAQLLDIRAPVELRKVGTPDIRGFKKKPVPISYNGEDKTGFLKRLSLKFKEPENTTLFILDKYDGNSELVAELVTVNGFKAAYAIKDGAEGPKGWTNSSLPWIPPSKTLSFDLSSLTDAFSIGDGSDVLPVTVTIAAAAGLGALAFSEIETILQVLGSAAIIQFASKKLLYAEERKQTLKQVDEFLNTKIAPKELADEIKQIGKALLPSTTTNKALPPPAEASSEPAAAENTVQKAEAVAEPAPQINSAKAGSVSGFSRPLSPYASYPDLKPPTSPTPSQP
ncbi:rhodanese-like domain-containing protein 4, chloroplastic [Ricinus communis]|uniref:rhodanese-like domain-containing protein 4, chloroplastic n=1 Tax=Ricinus communis TaxID=3988 RepID=UPI00201A8006|nr:rhodanese-like domain-containing protein 4, chloroplastic [Ricinus communis]